MPGEASKWPSAGWSGLSGMQVPGCRCGAVQRKSPARSDILRFFASGVDVPTRVGYIVPMTTTKEATTMNTHSVTNDRSGRQVITTYTVEIEPVEYEGDTIITGSIADWRYDGERTQLLYWLRSELHSYRVWSDEYHAITNTKRPAALDR